MITKTHLTHDELIKILQVISGKLRGFYIDTDGIQFDLDGKSLAKVLSNSNIVVLDYKDIGTNGLITCTKILVSTNGWVSKR